MGWNSLLKQVLCLILGIQKFLFKPLVTQTVLVCGQMHANYFHPHQQ